MSPAPHSVFPSPIADTLARRLLALATAAGASDDDRAAVAERVVDQLRGGLSRWFGPDGSRTLLARALAHAQQRHPALCDVALSVGGPVAGICDAARAHGTAPLVNGLIAMVAALADLLGRLIGDDLAASLLEQSAGPITGSMVDDPLPVKMP